jgi:hypothetical protein
MFVDTLRKGFYENERAAQSSAGFWLISGRDAPPTRAASHKSDHRGVLRRRQEEHGDVSGRRVGWST